MNTTSRRGPMVAQDDRAAEPSLLDVQYDVGQVLDAVDRLRRGMASAEDVGLLQAMREVVAAHVAGQRVGQATVEGTVPHALDLALVTVRRDLELAFRAEGSLGRPVRNTDPSFLAERVDLRLACFLAVRDDWPRWESGSWVPQELHRVVETISAFDPWEPWLMDGRDEMYSAVTTRGELSPTRAGQTAAASPPHLSPRRRRTNRAVLSDRPTMVGSWWTRCPSLPPTKSDARSA